MSSSRNPTHALHLFSAITIKLRMYEVYKICNIAGTEKMMNADHTCNITVHAVHRHKLFICKEA